MKAKNSKRFAAYGQIAGVALASVLFLGSGVTTRAQSGDDNTDNGLEGAWRLQVTVRDCHTRQALRTFPAVFTFSKGGTATVITTGQLPSLATPGLGVWRQTGDHNYSAVTDVFVFSPAGTWIQTHRLTRAIQVSDDGDSFNDQVALQILDAADNPIATGCATSVARRLE
jgi:hypothetical protein